MHGVTRHNDRRPWRDVELLAGAVKAKPAFKHFKDFLALFVKVERRPYQGRDVCLDDREGPPDISTVQAHSHLLASHRIDQLRLSPRPTIAPLLLLDAVLIVSPVRAKGFRHWVRQRTRGATLAQVTVDAEQDSQSRRAACLGAANQLV
jgi:hypothetical protein